MSDEYYDEDGFRLCFEDDTSEQEKQFFMRAFPNVNKISERKVHCTSCYMHIGTAPISEAVIRMHPVLRVTHCRNCHTFYNSGEFDKGEDGSELYCRWCGQGGEVYCCSKCPYVFCKKCIVQNLSRACVQDISRNDNWQCFSCAPKIMWHLRAQHWALSNYIEKQKKDMKDKNMSVQTINNLMKQDNTACCSNKGVNKKAGGTPTSVKKGTKRASDASELSSPGAAKIPKIAPRPMMQQQQLVTTPPSVKKQKTDNNEVVCTPDIMSMFMNPEEPPPLVAARTAQIPKAVPPVVAPAPAPQRQVVVRPAIPSAANPVPMRLPIAAAAGNVAPPPVYHTINGYRIDLHTAAQQGTYRLPNGKLIQVRKQAPTSPAAPAGNPRNNVTIAPKPPNAYFNPAAVVQNPAARMANGGTNVHINLALQQQQQVQEQRLQQQRQHQQQQQMLAQQRQQQQQQQQQQHQQQMMMQSGQPQPTNVAGQPNPVLQLPTLVMLQNMVNGTHEDSPLGRSRKNFEGKLLSGVEICQHIVSKINTLTNSNSFKNIRNVRDLKELYIHVSYLLTYAIGRFKTLQEKCVDDVKKMGFTKESDFVMMGDQISNRNPDEDKSDDEEDCEIIEQNTTCINLDSDDEDDAGKKKKSNSTETEAAVAALLGEDNDANNSGENILCMEDLLQISMVDSEAPAEGNDEPVTLVDDERAAEGTDADAADTSDSTAKEATANDGEATANDGEATATDGEATEVAESEKEKGEDDLVEIIEAHEEDNADKVEASKDDEKSEQSKKSTDGELVEAGDESKGEKLEKVEDAESEKCNVDKTTEEAKEEAVKDEESTVEVKGDTTKDDESKSEKSKEEAKDDEMTDAESKPVNIIEDTKDVEMKDESENKENESPKTEAEVVEISSEESVAKDAEEKQEKDEETLADKMEVDAASADQATEEEAEKEINKKSEDSSAAVEIEDENSATVVVEPVKVATDSEEKPTEDTTSEQAEEMNKSESGDENSVAIDEPVQTVADNAETPAEDTTSEEEKDVTKSLTDAAKTAELAEPTAVADDLEKDSNEDCVDETTTEKLSETDAPAKPVEEESDVASASSEVTDAPTGNELFSKIEDTFQKLQEMFESTEEATTEEADKTAAVDVDEDMAEEVAPEKEQSTEQMEVDEDRPTESEKVNSSDELQEEEPVAAAAAENSEAVAPVEENGLEEIVSAENFVNSQESLKEQQPSPEAAVEEEEKVIKTSELESINSPDGFDANGVC